MTSTRLSPPPVLHEGPPPLLSRGEWILGHAREYGASRLRAVVRARGAGDVVRIRLLHRELTLVFRPEDVERVLVVNAANYDKSTPGYAQLAAVMGRGLLTSDGDLWKRQRRIVQPLFTRQAVAGFADVIAHAVDEVSAAWRAAAQDGRAVDAAHDMNVLTLRVVARALFRSELDDATCDLLGRSLEGALAFVIGNVVNPLPFSHWLPTRVNREGRRGARTLDRIVRQLVAGRRGQPPRDPPDLIDRLAAAVDPETGVGMAETLLRDEAITMLLAGHETTSNALAWTFALLARHPDVVTRLEAEVDGLEADPGASDLPRLGYTWQVLQESMRLYPPAWIIARRALGPDVLGGYRIPTGAYVLLSQYAIHRHPALWDDPERFDPERFAPDRERERTRFAYFPFSGGQRQCIGDTFARLEATLVLATLARRFRLARAGDATLEPLASVTLRPRDGVPLTVTTR